MKIMSFNCEHCMSGCHVKHEKHNTMLMENKIKHLIVHSKWNESTTDIANDNGRHATLTYEAKTKTLLMTTVGEKW